MHTPKLFVWSLLPILFISFGLTAQTQPEYIKAAEEYYQYGDYANAGYLYGKALKFDTTDQNLRFLKAESHLRYKVYARALREFAKIEASDVAANFPRLPYLMGKAEQPLGNYDSAIFHFDRFLRQPGDTPDHEVEDAERQLENAKWAKVEVARNKLEIDNGTQSGIDPIHYTDVNTRFDDFSPFFRSDSFYFSSLRFRMEDDSIKPSRKLARILSRNTNRTDAINRQLPENINQKGKVVAHSAFNSAGTMVYFTYCQYLPDTLSTRCDIYAAPVSPSGDWGAPQLLSINSSGANTTQPNVGMHPDGKEYLYFASDRSGGMGMHDLYRSPIDPEGNLGQVERLDDLNTAFDDVTPFFNGAKRELYFSTNGRETLGELDVYRAVMKKPGWSKPVHMGIPTNSSYNDVYYARFEKHDSAYFASNRHEAEALFWDEEKEVCCNDIYMVEIETICLEVTTFHALTLNELNDVTVTFYEEMSDGELIELAQETHPEDNFYTFEVEKGRKYRVTAIKRGFKGTDARIDVTIIPDLAEGASCIQQPLYLPPPTIRLEVITLDKRDSSKLDSVTVALSSGPSDRGTLVSESVQTKPDSNFYAYDIVQERFYEIFGSKPEYTPDSAMVDTRGLFVENDTVIKRKLFLKKMLPDPCDIKPQVFFDNDIPTKVASMHTLTTQSYRSTYEPYMQPGRRARYLNEYDKISSESRFLDSIQLAETFTSTVEVGMNTLDTFALMLREYLSGGGDIMVTLEGFASPLSNGPYNDKLSTRRCMSVIKYLIESAGLEQYKDESLIMVEHPDAYVKAPNTYRRKSHYDNMRQYEGFSIATYAVDPPDFEGKLIFNVLSEGEKEVDPDSGLVATGPASIYAPAAIGARYVKVNVAGCPQDSDSDSSSTESQR